MAQTYSLSKIQLSQLLQTYGNLLTDKQREAVAMYCDCDCSLAEIADEVGISRQGVRAAIVGAEKTLTQLDDALDLVEEHNKLLAVENMLEHNDVDGALQIIKQLNGKE